MGEWRAGAFEKKQRGDDLLSSQGQAKEKKDRGGTLSKKCDRFEKDKKECGPRGHLKRDKREGSHEFAF
jgi:hypothetical protein